MGWWCACRRDEGTVVGVSLLAAAGVDAVSTAVAQELEFLGGGLVPLWWDVDGGWDAGLLRSSICRLWHVVGRLGRWWGSVGGLR